MMITSIRIHNYRSIHDLEMQGKVPNELGNEMSKTGY